jgi:hypothetical protein
MLLEGLDAHGLTDCKVHFKAVHAIFGLIKPY